MSNSQRSYPTSSSASLLLLAGSFVLTPISEAKDAFPKGCTLPYESIAVHHPIDKTCPPEGKPADDAHAAEYRAKNNLCIDSPARDIPFWVFEALQNKSDQLADDQGLTIGNRNVAWPDRSTLADLVDLHGKALGEGTVVRLVAFLRGAKQEGLTGSGEGVDCNEHGKTKGDANDVHIDLGVTSNALPCQGIVAEMIPHYRPDSWSADTLAAVMQEGHPVRVSGPLFFDSRHLVSTCDDPKKGQPPRLSVWEIHPVYGFDVCTNATKKECPATDDSVWVALDQWQPSDQ